MTAAGTETAKPAEAQPEAVKADASKPIHQHHASAKVPRRARGHEARRAGSPPSTASPVMHQFFIVAVLFWMATGLPEQSPRLWSCEDRGHQMKTLKTIIFVLCICGVSSKVHDPHLSPFLHRLRRSSDPDRAGTGLQNFFR